GNGNTFGNGNGDDGKGDDSGLFGDGTDPGDARFTMDSGSSDSLIDPDAFWANDPPPMWCGPDGGNKPPTPGGTVECPDDKNREGCPCTTEGQMAACWPGLRANRGIGICKDGTTTCITKGETQKVWGPCMGYVLPQPGATKGKEACKCFSAGQWAIANLSPCF